jgi:hypothetical protein
MLSDVLHSDQAVREESIMVFVPKLNWQDSPSTATPITAAELIRIENGIVEGAQKASEVQVGNVELASAVEMAAGNDITRPPSVKHVADYVSTAIAAAIDPITGVPNATETVRGIVEFGTAAEMTTGNDETRATSVKRVVDYVDGSVTTAVNAHTADSTPHPITDQAITELQVDMANKVSLVGGLVDINQIPKSQTSDASSIAQRTSDGALSVADASAPSHAVPLSQAQFLFSGSGGGSSAIVRDLFGTSLPVSASDATTFVKIPDVKITDGKTGDKWRFEYSIKYRASATGGISLQHSGSAVGSTNLLPNPSFETNTSGWSAVQGTFTGVRSTTEGQVGSASCLLTCTATGSYFWYVTDWIPAIVGTDYSLALQIKLATGTAKNARIDLEYLDDDGTTITRTTGTAGNGGEVLTSSSWQRAVNNAAPVAPSGTTHVRLRLVWESPAIGDAIRIDAAQLEPTGTVPAFGNTGGASALTIDGWWSGLTLSAPTVDSYSRLQTYRTAAGLAASTFGGLGTTVDAQLIGSFVVDIGGTALQNQTIEFEFKQKTLDGANPTQIVAANLTVVELP